MKKHKNGRQALAVVLAVSMACGIAGCQKKEETPAQEFVPRLDTEKSVHLEMAGFMANFEALDQVINHFNQIYPNVTITYEQNSTAQLAEYVKNNSGIDIFMTKEDNISNQELPENYVKEDCLDLSKEDIDFQAVSQEALSYCTYDGAVLRVPITMNPCGIAVNETLLDQEGLQVPGNYEEFLAVLEALKEKGYLPIQGSAIHVYSELMVNMAMNLMAEDETLLPGLRNGDEAAVARILPVFERLKTIVDAGYTDYWHNANYPTDNYDKAILSFLEGDMPFWVCTAESFSGVKKRETKSTVFADHPFEYEFFYAPVGDTGAYAYTEPWYGFSVNKNSDDRDYAVEFIRFLVTREQLNQMAQIKGMPSAAEEPVEGRYPRIYQAKDLQGSFDNDGSIRSDVRDAFNQVCTDLGAGVYKTAEEAARAFADSL